MYQVIIVGAGPAGLAAGLYAQRYKLNYLVLGQTVGGTALEATVVENYPGFKSTNGLDLMKLFQDQLEPDHIKQANIQSIEKANDHFVVKTFEKQSFEAQTLILAMGTKIKKLNIQNEDKLVGNGISYCASCDGYLTKNKVAAVVGGGNSGGPGI